MRLAAFIAKNKEAILQAWEDFARSIAPPVIVGDIAALRDHASSMLDAFVADLGSPQTEQERLDKSLGKAPPATRESDAESHGRQRLLSGYTIDQLVSEFRALRASVLRLWSAAHPEAMSAADMEEVNRFNEAIDQALAESVSRFSRVASSTENERSRLEAILETAPVGICMMDKGGKVILHNAENQRIWGYVMPPGSIAEYAQSTGWWANGSGKHGQAVQPHEWAAARVLAGQQARGDVVEIEPWDAPGLRRTISLHAAPIHDAAGRVVGAVVAHMDITALVQAEAALRDSESKFRTIANAMPQMIWSTLPDGFHDYFNDRWHEFTGIPTKEMASEEWMASFHPDDRQRASELWRKSLSTGEVLETQYRLRHHSGEYRWVLARALPVRDMQGQITRWMGTCTDIHDQKLAEEELRQGSHRMDEFLAMLAHELRNPLAPIATASQLLSRKGMSEERAAQASAIISRQVSHMSNLVDDLLDVSRVKRGLVTLEKQVQDIKPIINSAIEQVRPLIEARGHAMTVRMSAESAYVDADRTRLVQVVSNLLNNAAKYTPRGGEIVLSAESDGGQVRVSVTDTGIGIDARLLPRVFDLFAQGARTPDRTQGGLGLGLALVKSMVELHGGAVQAMSEGPGRGSTFTISLPLHPPPARAADRHRLADAAAPARSLRLMVVDDNVDAAETLASLLSSAGHQVTVKYDSKSALEGCEAAPPQALVLDIGLPDLDGYELARRLKAKPETSQATLIALTGYGQPHDRVLAKSAGFDYHFVKPVDVAALEDVLSRIGDRRRSPTAPGC